MDDLYIWHGRLNEKLSHDLTSGKKLVSYCLTEPNSGSDALALDQLQKRW